MCVVDAPVLVSRGVWPWDVRGVSGRVCEAEVWVNHVVCVLG